MNRENYQKVRNVFDAALELAPTERDQFLAEACADDQRLRQEVESLLATYQTGFLEKPMVGEIAELLTDTPPQLHIGQTIGHYTILQQLGAGGMGEVYLAQDTKLNRHVALKVLHQNLSSDNSANRRLLREAQAAALLDHPHICQIHEISESDDCSFIVMQYVAGKTLAEVLAKERLSAEKSLDLAIQICDALTEAHTHGIIHRDIKPANIIVNEKGQAKVLDFGLAKFIEAKGNRETTQRLSISGAVMGTVPYMSPEQLRGEQLDARTDIFSFGTMFYEMLSGEQPFSRKTNAETISAILNDQPDWTKIPRKLQLIARKSLVKNKDERYQTAQDLTRDLRAMRQSGEFLTESDGKFKNQLQTKKASHWSFDRMFPRETAQLFPKRRGFRFWKRTTSGDNTAPSPKPTEKIIPWVLTAIFGVLLLSAITALVWKSAPRRTLPFSNASRPDLRITSLMNFKSASSAGTRGIVFSPEGGLLAFHQAGQGAKLTIYVKQINGGEPIKVTEGNWVDYSPVWSADEQRLAFLSNRDNMTAIWAIPYLGGTPVLLGKLDVPQKQTIELKKWSRDGRTIYYQWRSNLHALDLTTGQSAPVTSLDPVRSKANHFSVSPAEDKIAYSDTADEKFQIFVQALSRGEPKQITLDEGNKIFPAWFPDNRHIAYSSDQSGSRQIYITDLEGGEPLQLTFGDHYNDMPAVSPDGEKIVFLSTKDQADIYSLNFADKSETAQTNNLGVQLLPNLSPDGSRLVFQSSNAIHQILAGSIKIKPLAADSRLVTIADKGHDAQWSPDNQTLAFLRLSGTEYDIWKVSANGQNEKQLTRGGVTTGGYMGIPFNLRITNYSWSPDGQRIAYISRKSGHYNVWTINSDGSNEMMWTRNTDDKFEITSPIWSPEGGRIAYLGRVIPKSAQDKEQYRVCIADANQTTVIFENELETRLLGWSADGAEFFIVQQKSKIGDKKAAVALLKLPVNAGQPQLINELPAAHLRSVKLSPGAKQVAFSARLDAQADNIHIVSTDSREIRQMTDNRDLTLFYSGITWSPDEKMLYYSRQSSGISILMITNSK